MEHTHTFEELGRSESHDLEVEIEFDATPGEPAVRTLPNGDPGYPGSPPECEWTEVHVTSFNGRVRDDDHWAWPLLDKIAEARVSADWDSITDDCFEQLADAEEAAKEAYYEAKFDRMRDEGLL